MQGKRFLVTGLALVVTLVLLNGLGLAQAPSGSPLMAAFTYQGRLESSDVPYNGDCDLQFGLWDALSGGTQVGITQTVPYVGLADGYFTVLLDWGQDKFMGESRWLDIAVRCPAGSGSYTPLTPRQQLTATPYALYAMAAPWPGLVGMPPGFADGVDDDTVYTTGPGLILTGTLLLPDPTYLQRRVSEVCASGYAIRVVNEDGSVTCEAVGGGGGSAWLLTGNAGTVPGTNYVGTSDSAALVFKVNNERAFRLEPSPGSPNVIGGYVDNWVYSGAYGAAIGGGGGSTDANVVTDAYGTIGGGAGNQAGDAAAAIDDAVYATVGGGFTNTASSHYSTVGGGRGNAASGNAATVGGGYGNIASGDDAAIGGGWANVAAGDEATIAGGWFGDASGEFAAIGGGTDNVASGESSFVGGGNTNTASGYHAMVVGGYNNVAQGQYSFAAGREAKAYQNGCFVWGDSNTAHVTCDAADRWVARASGGVYFYTNSGFTSGSYLAAGGSSWNAVSSRALKENLARVDTGQLLERLARIDIGTWNYKAQDPAIRHIGPMAEDFNALVDGLGGEGADHINTLDADGVALAAIQGLYARNQALAAENTALQQRVDSMDARLAALEAGRTPAAPLSLLPGAAVGAGLVLAVASLVLALRRRGGAR